MTVEQDLHLHRDDPLPVRAVGETQAVTERSALAVHRDPSLAKQAREKPTAEAARRVIWARPTELVDLIGGRVAGRGIDLQTELARRARRVPIQAVAVSRRGISKRAHRLPPVSAFGKPAASSTAITRSGMGRR